jgi:hypothetical protein
MAACRRGYAGKLTDQWQLLRFHDGNCRRMAASCVARIKVVPALDQPVPGKATKRASINNAVFKQPRFGWTGARRLLIAAA